MKKILFVGNVLLFIGVIGVVIRMFIENLELPLWFQVGMLIFLAIQLLSKILEDMAKFLKKVETKLKEVATKSKEINEKLHELEKELND